MMRIYCDFCKKEIEVASYHLSGKYIDSKGNWVTLWTVYLHYDCIIDWRMRDA